MSQVTTHVLDTAKGKPAEGIQIVLYRQDGIDWMPLSNGVTDKDGRIADLLETDTTVPAGVYKLDFFTKAYFDQLGLKTFYPLVSIIFEIMTVEHYHIPLLLSPHGFTTYRGS